MAKPSADEMRVPEAKEAEDGFCVLFGPLSAYRIPPGLWRPGQWLLWAARGEEMATASAGISASRSKCTKTPSWFPCSQTSPPFKSAVFKDSVTGWEPPVLHSFLPLFFFLKRSAFVTSQPHDALWATKRERALGVAPFMIVCRLASPEDASGMRRREKSSFYPPPFCQDNRQCLWAQAACKTHKIAIFLAKVSLILSR